MKHTFNLLKSVCIDKAEEFSCLLNAFYFLTHKVRLENFTIEDRFCLNDGTFLEKGESITPLIKDIVNVKPKFIVDKTGIIVEIPLWYLSEIQDVAYGLYESGENYVI